MANKSFSILLLLALTILIGVLVIGFSYIYIKEHNFNRSTFYFSDKPESNGFNELSSDNKTLTFITKLNHVYEKNNLVYGEFQTDTKKGVNTTEFLLFNPNIKNDSFVIEKITASKTPEYLPPIFLTSKDQALTELKKLEGATVTSTIFLNSVNDNLDLNQYKKYIDCNIKFSKALSDNRKISCLPSMGQIKIYEQN